MKKALLSLAFIFGLAICMQQTASACDPEYGEYYVYRLQPIGTPPYVWPQYACVYPDMDMTGPWRWSDWTDYWNDTQPKGNLPAFLEIPELSGRDLRMYDGY